MGHENWTGVHMLGEIISLFGRHDAVGDGGVLRRERGEERLVGRRDERRERDRGDENQGDDASGRQTMYVS